MRVTAGEIEDTLNDEGVVVLGEDEQLADSSVEFLQKKRDLLELSSALSLRSIGHAHLFLENKFAVVEDLS